MIPFVHDSPANYHLISSRLFRNSEAIASESLENLEECFPGTGTWSMDDHTQTL